MEGNGFHIHLPVLASCQRAFIGKPQLEPGTLVGSKAVFFLLEAQCLLWDIPQQQEMGLRQNLNFWCLSPSDLSMPSLAASPAMLAEVWGCGSRGFHVFHVFQLHWMAAHSRQSMAAATTEAWARRNSDTTEGTILPWWGGHSHLQTLLPGFQKFPPGRAQLSLPGMLGKCTEEFIELIRF